MNNIIDLTYVKNEQKRFLEYLKEVKGNYQEENKEVPKWLVLALITELSEVTNESKIHKWWDDSSPDEEKLKEELADFMAHLGNLANFTNVDMIRSVDEVQLKSIEDQIIWINYKIYTLPWKVDYAQNTLLNFLLPDFIRLVYSFGFDMQEIKEAYFKKMNDNYSRFKEGI